MPAPIAAPRSRTFLLALAMLCGSAQAQTAAVTLQNPGFDADASGWSAAAAAEADAWALWVADDASGDGDSGAVEFASTGADPFTPWLRSDTCIVPAEEASAAGLRPGDLEVRVRMRYRVLAGSGSVLAVVEQGFSGDMPATDPACIGPSTGLLPLQATVSVSDGPAQFDSGWQPLSGAPLAELSVGFRPHAGAVFVALIDDVQFELRTSEHIFGHGFAD